MFGQHNPTNNNFLKKQFIDSHISSKILKLEAEGAFVSLTIPRVVYRTSRNLWYQRELSGVIKSRPKAMQEKSLSTYMSSAALMLSTMKLPQRPRRSESKLWYLYYIIILSWMVLTEIRGLETNSLESDQADDRNNQYIYFGAQSGLVHTFAHSLVLRLTLLPQGQSDLPQNVGVMCVYTLNVTGGGLCWSHWAVLPKLFSTQTTTRPFHLSTMASRSLLDNLFLFYFIIHIPITILIGKLIYNIYFFPFEQLTFIN